MSKEHSHELFDEETYKLYAPNRKLTEEQKKQAYEMIKVGGDAKLITQHLREETGKSIIPKQIHNIKQKFQILEEKYTGNDIEDLKTVIICFLNNFLIRFKSMVSIR